MPTYRTPKPLSVETSILYKGKWRLVSVRGQYVNGEVPELQFVILAATGGEIKAELTNDQRTIIVKELGAAAKRDSVVFRPWENKRRG
jgi:hypothetical protein